MLTVVSVVVIVLTTHFCISIRVNAHTLHILCLISSLSLDRLLVCYKPLLSILCMHLLTQCCIWINVHATHSFINEFIEIPRGILFPICVEIKFMSHWFRVWQNILVSAGFTPVSYKHCRSCQYLHNVTIIMLAIYNALIRERLNFNLYIGSSLWIITPWSKFFFCNWKFQSNSLKNSFFILLKKICLKPPKNIIKLVCQRLTLSDINLVFNSTTNILQKKVQHTWAIQVSLAIKFI